MMSTMYDALYVCRYTLKDSMNGLGHSKVEEIRKNLLDSCKGYKKFNTLSYDKEYAEFDVNITLVLGNLKINNSDGVTFLNGNDILYEHKCCDLWAYTISEDNLIGITCFENETKMLYCYRVNKQFKEVNSKIYKLLEDKFQKSDVGTPSELKHHNHAGENEFYEDEDLRSQIKNETTRPYKTKCRSTPITKESISQPKDFKYYGKEDPLATNEYDKELPINTISLSEAQNEDVFINDENKNNIENNNNENNNNNNTESNVNDENIKKKRSKNKRCQSMKFEVPNYPPPPPNMNNNSKICLPSCPPPPPPDIPPIRSSNIDTNQHHQHHHHPIDRSKSMNDTGSIQIRDFRISSRVTESQELKTQDNDIEKQP